MSTAETTRTQTTGTPAAESELDPFSRAVQTAAGASTALALPALCLAVSSLSAAVLVWGAWVAPFMTASLVSVVASLGALVLLAAPGLILLKVQHALHEVGRLPDRIVELRSLARVDFLAAAREEAKTAAGKKLIARVKAMTIAYARAAIDLRTALINVEESLTRIAGAASLAALVTSPVACIVAGFAAAASTFITLFGALALLKLTIF